MNSINWGPDRRGGSIIQYPWSEEMAPSPERWRWELTWTAAPPQTAVSATFFVTSDQIGHTTRAPVPRPIKLTLSHPWRDLYWEVLLDSNTSIGASFCIPHTIDTQLMDTNFHTQNITWSKFSQKEFLQRWFNVIFFAYVLELCILFASVYLIQTLLICFLYKFPICFQCLSLRESILWNENWRKFSKILYLEKRLCL